MRRVQFGSIARADILVVTDYLFKKTGRQTLVHRFLASLEETTIMLAQHPQVGRSTIVQERELRRFVVRRFHNYLILYTFRADTLRVVRVLHGARDIASILGDQVDLES